MSEIELWEVVAGKGFLGMLPEALGGIDEIEVSMERDDHYLFGEVVWQGQLDYLFVLFSFYVLFDILSYLVYQGYPVVLGGLNCCLSGFLYWFLFIFFFFLVISLLHPLYFFAFRATG